MRYPAKKNNHGHPERTEQVRRKQLSGSAQLELDAERAQIGHFQPAVAARIDAAKRLQVHRNVEREAMITAAAADPQPDARELAAVDIDTGRVAPAHRGDVPRCEQSDDAVLESHHELPHAERATADVEQRIDDELTGAVIRDLAAAIDLHQRNVAGRQHVLGRGVHAEREHRRMFEKPDFVGGLGPTLFGERLHRSPCRLVLGTTEPSQQRLDVGS
jgi:hypothetical protein